MPASQATVSSYDAGLKRVYQSPIVEILNNEILLLKLLDDNQEEYGGKGVSWGVEVARNPSVGARADGGTLMAAGSTRLLEAQVSAFYLYGRGRLTGPTMKVSRSDKYAMAKALGREIKALIKALKKESNFWFHGDGTGTRCIVDGAVTASTSITVRWAGQTTPDLAAPGIKFLRRDMNLLIGTAAEIAAGTAEAVTVDSFTDSDTFVAAAAETLVDADLVVEGDANGNSRNNGPAGLQSIVDDDTGTFQNISRSTYPEYRGTVLGNSGTARAISEDLIQRAIDTVQIRAGGVTKCMICDPSMRRQILAIGQADRRFLNQKFELGFEKLEYASGAGVVPIWVDPDCVYNSLYGLDLDTLSKMVLCDFEFADDDGHVLRNVSGVDAWEFMVRWFGNLVCDNPAANWRLEDLTATGLTLV